MQSHRPFYLFPLKQAVTVAAKRTILTACAFFVALWAFLGALFTPIPASAEEVQTIEDTTIEADLADVDLTQFPADGTGSPRILDGVGFAEYCYSLDAAVAADYGVYLYLYNPTERALAADGSVANMAITYNRGGEPQGYANIDLAVIDHTDNHRFYKIRIESDSLYDVVTEYAAAHDGVRRYDIAGLQIMYADGSNAEDFGAMSNDYGYTYRVTGFAKGCGEDPNAESTLDVKEDRLTIVPLEVHRRTTAWDTSTRTAQTTSTRSRAFTSRSPRKRRRSTASCTRSPPNGMSAGRRPSS